MAFHIERITTNHDRSTFDCGDFEMNDYLLRFGRQNDIKNVSRTFVAVRPGTREVLGYYTLSSASVAFLTFPPDARRGLARYPVPVAHLGRLATDKSMQGQGLGAALLIDALRRVVRVSADIAVYAIDVLALNESARRFYLKFGFRPLVDDPLHLYMAIQTARAVAAP